MRSASHMSAFRSAIPSGMSDQTSGMDTDRPRPQVVAQRVAILAHLAVSEWLDPLVFGPPAHPDDHRPRHQGVRQVVQSGEATAR